MVHHEAGQDALPTMGVASDMPFDALRIGQLQSEMHKPYKE